MEHNEPSSLLLGESEGSIVTVFGINQRVCVRGRGKHRIIVGRKDKINNNCLKVADRWAGSKTAGAENAYVLFMSR